MIGVLSRHRIDPVVPHLMFQLLPWGLNFLSRYPRINKESLLPVAKDVSYSGENTEAWYPPGHGDIYASFYNSGLLDTFIEDGREYIFVSNIDNLGATVDLYILNHLMNSPNGKRCEFVMEVTNKTRADVKVKIFNSVDFIVRKICMLQFNDKDC